MALQKTSSQNSRNNVLVAEALNTLNNRIEKTETDFIGHLQKVEDKLDQIVELTKTVAVLQQQSAQQTDQIVELRTQVRENGQKFDNSISRIHTRLDEITNHQRDKLELHSKDFEMKLTEVKNLSDRTDKDFRQWLNRGWGVWALASLIFIAAQGIGYRWMDSIEKEKAVQVQLLKELSTFKDRAEIQLKQDSVDIANIKTEAAKNAMTVRDLEDIYRRPRP